MWKPFDPEQAEVVALPEGEGAGCWVGAPSVRRDGDRILLCYRRRRPRGQVPDRGYATFIASSTDGLHFEDIAELPKAALGTTSIERCALCPDPRGSGWLWFVSYVDPADGRWRIDALAAATIAGLPAGERRTVLTAGDIDAEGVKDPVVLAGPDGLVLIVSAAARSGTEGAAALHATFDAYNTGLVQCFSGLATSEDGRSWTWHGACLRPGEGWDRYQARLGCALPIGPVWVGLYDGSASVQENYEECLGVATSADLSSWTSLTPDGPAVRAAGSGSVRYADFLPDADGLWLYFECARADGAHDLRRVRLRFKPA